MIEPTAGPSPARCPSCGSPQSAGAMLGFCPGCLLQSGKQAAETLGGPAAAHAIPVTQEEMALLFPELEIQRLLGRGGMGIVYLARQPALDRLVAVKVLPTEDGDDPQFTERFRREAAALARLKHPNIVTLYDYGERGGFLYFLMEFIDGVDLAQRIDAGSISTDEALRIVPQICDALEFSHAKGIVHRDIKPANILIDRSTGQVKIADFGLAKFTEQTDASALDTRLTMTNMALGTPRYMAPEQMDNAPSLDHRVDLYALGVVLYEMLTGKPPAGSFEAPSARQPAVDERMDEVVLKAMEASPERRYRQASEIKVEFTEAMRARSRFALTKRQKAFLKRVAPASILAIILSIAAVLWLNREGSGPPTESEIAASQMTMKGGKVIALPLPGLPPSQVSREDIPAILKNQEIVQLAVSDSNAEHFGLALLANGTVRAWGNNAYGQCDVPVDLPPCIAVAVGKGEKAAHSLALTSDGKVVAWGDDSYRQASVPADLRDVVQIAAGQFHSVALLGDGTVSAWGYDLDGVSAVPRDLGKIKAITAGAFFSAALASDGRIIAWGAIRASACAPPALLDSETVTYFAAGTQHMIAATDAGEIFIWGQGLATARHPADSEITTLTASDNWSAAVDSNNQLLVFPRNQDPQILASDFVIGAVLGSNRVLAIVRSRSTGQQ